MKIQLIISAILGFLGVAIGAFGAHGLKGILEVTGKLEQFETANRYHWYHTFAIFGTAILFYTFNLSGFQTANWLFLAGVIVFSGSLYIYSLTGVKWLAMITPIGGLFLLLAWALLLWTLTKI